MIIHAVPNIAELILVIADKLVAGIQVAPRGDCHVFGARTAARNALVDARAARQVYHIVVECYGLALFFAPKHVLGEYLVLLKEHGQVVVGQRVWVVGRADDRLHRELGKAEVCHMEDVVGEVGVVVGKGAANVVASPLSPPYKLLKFGNDNVVAALAVNRLAQIVVYLFSAVKTKHHVVALAVGKLDNVVVNKHSVGGQRKAEILVVLFFYASRVGDYLLYHVEVHQRLTAEEVDLKIHTAAGVLYKKIYSAFSHLKAHQRAFAVVLPLACKAVLAIEVAGVRDMQAERLDHGVALFEVKG